MKIRIKGNSVRLRLTRTEVETFCEKSLPSQGLDSQANRRTICTCRSYLTTYCVNSQECQKVSRPAMLLRLSEPAMMFPCQCRYQTTALRRCHDVSFTFYRSTDYQLYFRCIKHGWRYDSNGHLQLFTGSSCCNDAAWHYPDLL